MMCVCDSRAAWESKKNEMATLRFYIRIYYIYICYTNIFGASDLQDAPSARVESIAVHTTYALYTQDARARAKRDHSTRRRQCTGVVQVGAPRAAHIKEYSCEFYLFGIARVVRLFGWWPKIVAYNTHVASHSVGLSAPPPLGAWARIKWNWMVHTQPTRTQKRSVRGDCAHNLPNVNKRAFGDHCIYIHTFSDTGCRKK